LDVSKKWVHCTLDSGCPEQCAPFGRLLNYHNSCALQYTVRAQLAGFIKSIKTRLNNTSETCNVKIIAMRASMRDRSPFCRSPSPHMAANSKLILNLYQSWPVYQQEIAGGGKTIANMTCGWPRSPELRLPVLADGVAARTTSVACAKLNSRGTACDGVDSGEICRKELD